MSPREFRTVQDVMKPALVALARDGGSVALGPLWEQIAGAAIARQVKPVSLADGTLVLEAATARWQAEVAKLETELLAKLRAIIGREAITRLSVRSARK